MILLFGRILGKDVYLWSHGFYGRESKTKVMVKRAFFGMAGKILLYGDYAKQKMIRAGFDADKLVVLYNSLDYDRQLKIRKGLSASDIYTSKFGNHDPVLLYIGRIQKRKKVELLVEALAILSETVGYPCNLVIIGKNVDKEASKVPGMIEAGALGHRVWMYGESYKEEELAELIYNADISVTPGDIGLTAMHSMSYGLPVITHNHFSSQGPEFEAVQPGVTGDFFKYDNVEDLVCTIKKWIDHSRSEKAAIRAACYKVIEEKYNPHNQISIIKSVLFA